MSEAKPPKVTTCPKCGQRMALDCPDCWRHIHEGRCDAKPHPFPPRQP